MFPFECHASEHVYALEQIVESDFKASTDGRLKDVAGKVMKKMSNLGEQSHVTAVRARI